MDLSWQCREDTSDQTIMSVHIIKGGKEDLIKELPRLMQVLSFKEINSGMDTKDFIIQGTIIKKWPLQDHKKSKLLKLTIEQDFGTAPCRYNKLNVFIMDDLAEQCDVANVGNILSLNNVLVENNTSADQCYHPCQLLVSTDSNPSIWMLKNHESLEIINSKSESDSSGQQPGTSMLRNDLSMKNGAKLSRSSKSPVNQDILPVPGSTQSKKVPQYKYTKLNELQMCNEVHIYGVVKWFRPVCQSRGEGCNYHMSLSIVDDSTVDNEQKLKCSLFARDPMKLPHITEFGQIIRFHRLKIGEYEGELQGVAKPGLSCLVFDKEIGGSMVPHTGNNLDTVTLTDEDHKRVEELRQWANQDEAAEILSQTPGDQQLVNKRTNTLGGLQLGQYGDVICQVVGKLILESNKAILFKVWDGTKATSPILEEPLTEDQMKQVEVDLEVFQRARGFMIDVKVYDDHFIAAVKAKPGDYLLLCNLHAARYKDPIYGPTSQIEFCLHKGTSYGRRLMILDPTESRQVHQLKLNLEQASASQLEESSLDDSILREFEMPVTNPTNQSKLLNEDLAISLNSTDLVTSGKDNSADIQNTSRKSPRRSPRISSCITKEKERLNRKRKSNEQEPSSANKTTKLEALDSVEDRCLVSTSTVIVDHHHIEKTSISNILNAAVPSKFRVRSHVLRCSQPQQATDMVRLYCSQCNFMSVVPSSHQSDSSIERWWEKCEPCRIERGIKYYFCPMCRKNESDHGLEYTYMVQMILDDGSGWMMVQLWRRNATTFFNDLPPEEIVRKKIKFERIKGCLEDLCPKKDPTTHRPLMECCVQSYNTQHGTCYQIFDTQYAIHGSG